MTQAVEEEPAAVPVGAGVLSQQQGEEELLRDDDDDSDALGATMKYLQVRIAAEGGQHGHAAPGACPDSMRHTPASPC